MIKISDLKKKKAISEDEQIVNDRLKVLDSSYLSVHQNHQAKASTIAKTNVLYSLQVASPYNQVLTKLQKNLLKAIDITFESNGEASTLVIKIA